MGEARRGMLGGLLGSSLLGQLVGGRWGSVSYRSVRIRWTRPALEELDRFGAHVEAVPPAELTGDGVWIPGRGCDDAGGSGVVDGGLVLRAPFGEVRIVAPEPELTTGVVSARCSISGADLGVQQLFRCGLSEGELDVEPAPPGRPLVARIGEVPARPVPESVELIERELGTSLLPAGVVAAHLAVEAVYTPPGR